MAKRLAFLLVLALGDTAIGKFNVEHLSICRLRQEATRFCPCFPLTNSRQHDCDEGLVLLVVERQAVVYVTAGGRGWE